MVYQKTKSMRLLKSCFYLFSFLFLSSCTGNMNPTGGNSAPNYPYFLTKEPLVVKKIRVPTGTKLIYDEHFFKEGQQEEMLSEGRLQAIVLPRGESMNWGGVPVTSISKFSNSAMRGFNVSADFRKLSDAKKTKFSELWKSCSNDLGITVKNADDWSFNTENISDVRSCSVLYQRFFKNNESQQSFLNTLYEELLKVGPN